MSPNTVLCYGAGGAFDGITPYMLTCGINVVGVIDRKGSGWKNVGEVAISVLSVEGAIREYGNDFQKVKIIITIADEKVVEEVAEDLVSYGFYVNNIFDMNVWSWLTVKSERCFCDYLNGYLQFFSSGLSSCCINGHKCAYIHEWFFKNRELKESLENFNYKRQYYREEAENGRIPLYCRSCDFLKIEEDSDDRLSEFIISDHAYCNADCIYCSDRCSVSKKTMGHAPADRYDAIISGFLSIYNSGKMRKNAVFQAAGGEITIHPQKEKIYDVMHKLEGIQIQILSNCFIYDEQISKLINTKNAFLQCDLDAGTPETYIKIKGFNKFYTVVENLKKYRKNGEIKIKYVVMPHWNDSEEDFGGMIRILEELDLKEVSLSPEFTASVVDDEMKKREICFSTARFVCMLKKKNITPLFSKDFWMDKDFKCVKRLSNELWENYGES